MLAVAVVWMRTVEWDRDWEVYFGAWLMSCGQWGESVFRCQEEGEGFKLCVLCCNLDLAGPAKRRGDEIPHRHGPEDGRSVLSPTTDEWWHW